jgi:parvulin-like peptidyl-prolyl isomerase
MKRNILFVDTSPTFDYACPPILRPIVCGVTAHSSTGDPVLNSTRIAFCHLFLLAFVVGLGYAQQPSKANAENKSAPVPATAKKTVPSAGRVVMKVGGVQVRQAEFESTIGVIEPQSDPDKGEAGDKDRHRLGDDYASVLMLSQLAVANHLDSTPEIRQKLALARLQILSDAEFARLLNQTKPSSSELNDYYQAHLSDFDRVQIRRLFIWKVGGGSKNTRGLPAADAKARAAAILQASASGDDSLKLAEMFKGSDQGLLDDQPLSFVRGQLPGKLDNVAFTMKPGQWAVAEDTSDHIILVYLAGRDRQPLSEVNSLVSRLVQGGKMQKELDGLKKKSGVWMDEQYFGRGSGVTTDPGEEHPGSSAPSNSGNQQE